MGEVFALLQQSDIAQLEVDKVEAANPSLFVAGWRPAIGWVCALALFYQYMLVPIGLWASFVAGHPIPKPPTLDDSLWQLMFGMLGMGALRSFEKLKGVVRRTETKNNVLSRRQHPVFPLPGPSRVHARPQGPQGQLSRRRGAPGRLHTRAPTRVQCRVHRERLRRGDVLRPADRGVGHKA
jgi:hypothetical protein